MRDPQREQLMPAVVGVLDDAALGLHDVTCIVCGAGPGSFTSLRIAAAIAKGLATALDRPLYAVSSLALMVAAAEPPLPAGEYLAVADALRGEVYAATCRVDAAGDVAEVGPVGLLGADELTVQLRAGRKIVGEGRSIAAVPHARGVARLRPLLDRATAVDLAGWEPAYGRVAEAQRRWEAAHGRPLVGG
jgi:tRNA threonylcarbamoyladenosine biosynthesis protein TsaB